MVLNWLVMAFGKLFSKTHRLVDANSQYWRYFSSLCEKICDNNRLLVFVILIIHLMTHLVHLFCADVDFRYIVINNFFLNLTQGLISECLHQQDTYTTHHCSDQQTWDEVQIFIDWNKVLLNIPWFLTLLFYCLFFKKYIIVFRWGRWAEIVSHSHFKRPLEEKDAKSIAKAIVSERNTDIYLQTFFRCIFLGYLIYYLLISMELRNVSVVVFSKSLCWFHVLICSILRWIYW